VKRTYRSPRILQILLFGLGALQITVLLVAFERPARAYVDPGSGFVFIQVAGSMFAGAVFYARHRLKPILNAVRRSSPSTLAVPEQRLQDQGHEPWGIRARGEMAEGDG
jgi:hypothetical protein